MRALSILSLTAALGVAAVLACAEAAPAKTETVTEADAEYPVHKSPAEWKKQLTPLQFRVLREAGTERAFTGKYWDHKEEGVYRCAGCNQPLYASKDKFKSGTGWPSFTRPVSEKAIERKQDRSYGMVRTELVCSRCGGHLGHVFNDGPPPTGQRHCINSASLVFEKAGAKAEKAKTEGGKTSEAAQARR